MPPPAAAPASAKTAGGPAAKGVATPQVKLAKARLVSALRKVRAASGPPIQFVLCIGNSKGVPYLGIKVTPSHRVQLRAFMGNDAGLRYHTGRCIWEGGAYTFVGRTVTSSLRAKVEKGMTELTGMKWRVRLRSGVVQDGGDEDDRDDART